MGIVGVVVQVLGQLTTSGAIQGETAEKLRTFLATAATAAGGLEVSEETKQEALQLQQQLQTKGNSKTCTSAAATTRERAFEHESSCWQICGLSCFSSFEVSSYYCLCSSSCCC